MWTYLLGREGVLRFGFFVETRLLVRSAWRFLVVESGVYFVRDLIFRGMSIDISVAGVSFRTLSDMTADFYSQIEGTRG